MFWLGLFVKYALPALVKWGWVNGGQADTIELWYWAKKNIKTTPEYPESAAQKAAEALSPGTTNANLVVGQGQADDGFPHGRNGGESP